MIEKRKTTMCALLTIMLFAPVVGGCSNGGGKVETTPTPEATAEIPLETPATITVAEATDEMLAKYSDFDEFDASIDEYGVKILVTTDTTVKNFRVFSIELDGTGEHLVEAVNGQLYRQDELTPEKPLILWASFPGTIPPVGIEYLDTDGYLKSFSIYMSGMDGSIQLEELTLMD